MHCTQAAKALWSLLTAIYACFLTDLSAWLFSLVPWHQWECWSRGKPLQLGLHWRGSHQLVANVDLGLWKSLCGVSWLTLFCLSPLELCHMSCQLHWSLTNALTQQVSSFTLEIPVKDFLVSFSSLSTCFVVVKNIIQQRILRGSVGYSLVNRWERTNIVQKSFYFQVTSVLVQTVEGSTRHVHNPAVKSICATFPVWRCGIPWCSKQFDLNSSFIQVKWLLSAAPSNTDDSLARAIWKMGSGYGRMIQLSLSMLNCL